ncbi:MAG TPA: SDR family NAD(P)-dependent oxidoreductase, partial [Myxococcaceae bacterium]|nr:SDR family NAD(P)-dependent oxidoreductase [Myxococcaceae bacterium]
TRSQTNEEKCMGMFDGKVAIITGAGAGIGRAHALAFGKEGARVVVNDLGGDRSGGGKGSEAADRVVLEIKTAGGEAVANYETVATREGAESILWTALSKYGRVDILVNNAGVLRDRSFLNMSDADWDVVNSVHLKGTFYCSQQVARFLKVQGKGGRIINTTSLSGMLGNFGQANYSAAKAGIYGLTRTMAIELAKANVTVNAIAPVALTRMTEDLAAMKGLSSDQVGPQLISPVVLFLASDLAADITGQVIGVHGPKLFVYRMEQTEGVEKDSRKGLWSPQEIREAWARIAGT